MQKVQSYLYPNRVILIADLAGFTVENTIVYAKTVKIYKGIDNVIQFDIQNADQKRLDLVNDPFVTNIQVNVMDSAGNALPHSPYSTTQVGLFPIAITGITVATGTATATFATQQVNPYAVGDTITIANCIPNNINGSYIVIACTTTQVQFAYASAYTPTTLGLITSTLKGVTSTKIPSGDLDGLTDQYLKYSVTGTDVYGNTIPLYTDSRFSAVGTMEIVESAMPTTRSNIVYDRFSGEINYMGNVTNHSSAIPCKFYEAVPTASLNFAIDLTNFIGTIYVEATEDSTISVESFRNATQIQSFTTSVATTAVHNFTNVPVGKYNYMRISWQYPDVWATGASDPSTVFGTVNKITVSS
jgi:hypothetical protein